MKMQLKLIKVLLNLTSHTVLRYGTVLGDRLQKLQIELLALSRVLHMTFHLISFSSSWNNLFVNRQKQKVILMFKTLNGQTPQYLQDMFDSRRGHYPLRNSNGKLFILNLN